MRQGARLILAGAALALPGAAEAQSLVLLAVNGAGKELLVDRASLRTDPPRDISRAFPAAQLRVEIRSPGGRRTGPVTERILYSFDCKGRTVATLAYYRGFADGRRSHDWQGGDLAMLYQPVTPASLAERAMDYACSGGQLPVAPLPQPAPPALTTAAAGQDDDKDDE